MADPAPNPSTPVAAGAPVPPPIPRVEIVDDKRYATPSFIAWCQLMWAAIQGKGGVIDQAAFLENAAFRNQISALDQQISELKATMGRVVSTDIEQRLGFLEGALGKMLSFPEPVEVLALIPPVIPQVPFQGVFTPTLIGSTTAGAQTYVTQTGTFFVYGQFVFINLYVEISAKDGAMAGDALIGGLPFQAGADYACSVGSWAQISSPASTEISFQVKSGTTTIAIYDNSSGALAPITVADLGATTAIQISGYYSQ